MQIVKCLQQNVARCFAIDAINHTDLILLQGLPLVGKSTVAKMLHHYFRRQSIATIFVSGANVAFYASLQHLFAHSLGLPNWVGSASIGVLHSVVSDLTHSGRSLLIIIDDIDTVFSVSESNNLSACGFIRQLAERAGAIKIIATFCELEDAHEISKKVFGYSGYVANELKGWQLDVGFENFIGRVGSHFRLHRRQLSECHFVSRLHELTAGASGAVIQVVKILVNSGRLDNGRIADRTMLSDIWRY